MNTDLQSLIEALKLAPDQLGVGVSHEDIAESERSLGFKLPSWIEAFYLVHHAIPAAPDARADDSGNMHLLPLRRAIEATATLPEHLGVFAIAEEDSDMLVQILDGALQGYIVFVPHDGDDRKLLFRTEGEYFRELAAAIGRSESTLRDLVASCGGAKSNEDDRAKAAAFVIDQARLLDSESRTFMLQLVCDLLDSHQTEAFQTLLDDSDLYIREAAELALRSRDDAPALELLRVYATNCAQFAERCRRLIEATGRVTAKSDSPSGSSTWGSLGVQTASGKVTWLSLAAFYGQRDNPDFDASFLKRVDKLASK